MALATTAPAQAVSGLIALRVAQGLTQPLYVGAPPGDTSRLFIAQRGGQILILDLATLTLNPTPFLDISASLTGDAEQGLLGLAFDPGYASNGKFYLNLALAGATPGSGNTRIMQFQVSGDPNVADPASVKTVLAFDEPQTSHNGGWIGFSPRLGDANNLYIATGDGGAENDQGTGHNEPSGNAQDNTTLLGKILRIHVDPATGTYTIPPDNPYVGSATAKQEIWAFGLRNPFRCSFDRKTGTMFIGDVGQNTREEIDVQQPANPGGGENYGWRLREGKIATPTGNPVVGGPAPGAVDPIYDYPHTTGKCVIGGYVYRGKQIPALQGVYVFGDYLGPSGPTGTTNKIFTLNYDGTSATNVQDITTELFPTAGTLNDPAALGEDANGELYIADITRGEISKIVPITPNVTIDSVTKSTQTAHFILHGSGMPFKNHTVQTTTDLTQPFSSPGTIVGAAGDGSIQFDDSNPGIARFYRITYP